MGKQFPAISPPLQRFIEAQHIFFTATAEAEGRVNLSPKGMDTLRVLSPNRVAWLSLTGSGNETSAHLARNDRITVMFCAFEGHPRILRLYGTATTVHRHDAQWETMLAHFDERPGTRNIIDCQVDLVQTSCGMAVPYFDYAGERDDLIRWAENKGPVGLEAYWAEKNTTSLDGQPITLPT